MELGLTVIVLLVCGFNVALGNNATTADCDCPANTYRNNHKLLSKFLRGWLYTQYSTASLGDNEIFNCDLSSGDHDFCRTTVDNQCCRSFNVTTKPANFQPLDRTAEYFTYLIETADTGCSVVVNERAHLKMLSAKQEFSKYCFMLWTCRKSRQGVHAFCNTQQISPSFQRWIVEQYAQIDKSLVPKVVKQDADYRNGVCFK